MATSRGFSVFLTAVLLFLSFPVVGARPAAAAHLSPGTYATTTSALNMRSGPGTGYYVQRVIPYGARVYVNRGPYYGDWYEVTYGGTRGYSYGYYLRYGGGGSGGGAGGYGKLVVVDLSSQSLYAYQGGSLQFSSLVTTGRPGHETPVGTFSVMAKLSPYRFYSPYPYGSEGYYEPFTAAYAIRFRYGGYYLHHAPYRYYFGPGTQQYGSLGCVNMPYWSVERLYYFVDIGTPVRVQW